jgi:hypothetical protein
MLFDALDRDLTHEQRVIFVAQRYQADVGRVAFVARTRVRKFHQLNSHPLSDT